VRPAWLGTLDHFLKVERSQNWTPAEIAIVGIRMKIN
jgi:hypothetical protein